MTGHKSDTAVESYHNRPTLEQQVQSSAIVSEFVAGSSKKKEMISDVYKSAIYYFDSERDRDVVKVLITSVSFAAKLQGT